MSCCGNKRNEYSGRSSSGYSSPPSVLLSKISGPAPLSKNSGDASFEYTGENALSVTGSITGKKYRFSGKGDIQVINWRDVSGMMAVPVLKRVKKT